MNRTTLPEQAITLPRSLVNQLLTQAQQSPDEEICGLVSSRNGQPAKAYPITNVATAADRLFQMDPKGLIDAMRNMRERDEQLIAIYHSHPHSPARPSSTDIQQANYPGVYYLIISLDTKGVLEIRAYRQDDNELKEVTLEIDP